MIDPKINIRSKPTHSAQQESLIKAMPLSPVQTLQCKPALTSSTSSAEGQMAGLKRTGIKQKPTSEKQQPLRGPKMQAEALARH